MHIHNLMSSQGFTGGMAGEFFIAWIGLAILSIIIILAKKWLDEEGILGIPFNWWGSLLGVLVYIVTATLTGSGKLSLVIGLIGVGVGGFFGATFFGSSE
jgi:hypothetical protein